MVDVMTGIPGQKGDKGAIGPKGDPGNKGEKGKFPTTFIIEIQKLILRKQNQKANLVIEDYKDCPDLMEQKYKLF